MPQQQSQNNVRERVEIHEPHKWAVIFWNDDFTTMEFVVKVLSAVFLKNSHEAEALMLKVHHEGRATVGIYSYDIAVSRIRLSNEMARKEGFPLKITKEEV